MVDALPFVRPRPLDAVVEDARLAALHAYRELSPRELDRLSHLAHHAASGFGARRAAVSFVGHTKVWFAGASGFTVSDTDREHSFCDAVVRSKAPLLVPDGSADPRFWKHPMVHGVPCLRSYAGAPLVETGGHTLGAVAVFSTRTAAFRHEILGDLSALASLVRDFLSESRPAPCVQGWLGVRTLRGERNRRGPAAGLSVFSVAKDSPAARAGLRPADILLSIDGHDLFVASDIVTAMARRVLGSWVQISFRRAGQWQECQADIVPRPRRVSGR